MDKKKQIQFNLNNFLLSISLALDLVEKDICKTRKNHSKRIAFISLKIAEKYDLKPQEMADLCAFALVHNIALKKENECNQKHFELAQSLVDKLPFLCGYKNVIKYHQENLDGSGVFGLKGDEIPFLSQILSFVHLLDTKFDLVSEELDERKAVLDFLEANGGVLFSKDIAGKFLEVSSTIDFWLDMQSENDILYFIFASLYDFTITPTFEEVLEYTSLFNVLDDNDNKFLNKCAKMSDFYNFEHKDKQTFLIAASMHNIGKLAIPSRILNKKSNLTDDEYEIIKSYPYYTKKILSNLMGFNDIANWACRVQENLDGTGYPFKLSGKDLSLKDRLMAALNVYQALTTKKSFRDAYSHKKAIKMMKQIADENKIDKAIVLDLEKELV